MDRLKLSYRNTSVYSLAAQQNSYRVFDNIKLHFTEDEERERSSALRDLAVTLSCESGKLLDERWEISEINPGQYVRLPDRPLQFSHKFLFGLSDETPLTFIFSVTS